MRRRLEASSACFSPCPDRFVTEGYKDPITVEEKWDCIGKIDELSGIGVGIPAKDGLDALKKKIEGYGKQVSTVCPDTYQSRKLKDGMLMARDPGMRRESIAAVKEAMDACAYLGGADILLWQAHDGYTYPFEDDYAHRWDFLMESLDEICAYRDDVKVTIEYKCKEPKCRQYISDVGKSLWICEQIKRDNLGIVVDLGHSLIVQENPAEALALAAKAGRLFHVHLNDNYRLVDDDLFVGAVHFWETLEFFYQMDAVGYDGWVNMDIYPYYIDGPGALTECIKRVRMFENLAEALPREEITKLQREGNLNRINEILRETCIKTY